MATGEDTNQSISATLCSKAKKLLARLALLAGSLLFLLTITEGTLRLVGAKPKTASILSAYFQPDALLGWVGRPNAAFQFATSDFDAFISHDRDGLRNGGLRTSLSDDVDSTAEVVWCVGDSTTYGWGVEDGKTHVDLLNQMSGDGRVYRNLGVFGYSTVQEYLLLKRHFERGCKPDAVLLLFCSNDLTDNLQPPTMGPKIEILDGKVVLRPCPPISSAST